MNILFICDEYPPGPSGGIGTSVQVLSRELVRQGHSVWVAGLYMHSYGQADYEIDNGVKVYRFRYGVKLFFRHSHIIHKVFNRIPGIIKQHLNGRKAFSEFVSFVNGLIETNRIEIIELPDWNTFAMRIGFKVEWPPFQIPLVVKSHGSYTYFQNESGLPLKPELHEIDLALYKRADSLAAVSIYTAEKNRELFNINRDVRVLYNGIEINNEAPEITRDKHTVVFSGTLIAKKGIYQLIKAWNIVHKKEAKAELLIFGKGDIEDLKKLSDPDASKKVHYLGHVPRQNLLKVLSTATISVFPSYSECFALAPMEAMAAGCPVIYTTRSSGRELINDGTDGKLVDPDKIDEVADGILTLLKDSGLRSKYSINGRNRVRQKFNITAIALDHLKYYEFVIKHFKNDKKNTGVL